MVLRVDISAQVTSIREMVYDTLKEAILSGQIEQGAHLKERDIAHNFGVSTTPVKEALRRLDQEGLVVTKPRVGTFVSNKIMSSIEEISWARSALEGVAARLAAIKVTDSDISRFSEHMDKLKLATEAGDGALIYQLNETLHKMILDISQNDYIVQQISAVRAFDRAVRKQALSSEEEFDRAYAEHFLIYEKIANRDPDGAEEAMRSHIRRTASFVTQLNHSK
ncbi:GntR family transcriptional regulator [Paenibacillus thalictri]|uniref:GntR family transcriptional regulator n=1 Tax=Paenibacillus thalictri TaxID=2527873 RepID=A0A4V2J3V9_9BACL|nr:GntR family transcriptional regulator [Paenibacillus thalictri]TBL75774.1 GntR family transcriptional regulator [Paenibacillus thalictri]